MAYTYQELKKKTAAQLKEIAAGMDHEAVKGYTQLNKDHLLVAICKALDIDTFVHHDVVGVDKKSIKANIRKLKRKRDEALMASNYKELKKVRQQIKKFKNKLRKAMV
jgi:radical SAM superfamily enzyme with C-terminal helix-hairpin-helix motif